MELTSQLVSNESSPPYVSAPSSPIQSSLNNMRFYSVPSSPTRLARANEELDSNFIDFEFETSKNFGLDGFDFETSQHYEYSLDDQQKEQQQIRHRSDSLPVMAFADELFKNGKVAPLKLPPRLVSINDATKCVSSTASSPRSPGSALKIPFLCRNMWNNDIDPFAVALEKVKEDKRGKREGSYHRRSRSHSPFRTTTATATATSPKWSNDSRGWRPSPMSPGPNERMESKGSPYARWVRDQNKQMGHKKFSALSPKASLKFKGFSFRWRVGPMKVGHEEPKGEKIEEYEGRGSSSSSSTTMVETRVQKIKGAFWRYASFGRERKERKSKGQLALWNSKRVISSKFRGSSKSNGQKKEVNGEPNMAITQYRPRLTLCLSFGMVGPRTMD